MAGVFFVYSHDGEIPSAVDAVEYAPNAEVARRELARRARTGTGTAHLLADMSAITRKAFHEAAMEDEWPQATADACLFVWRIVGVPVPPSGPPQERWGYSGQIDRPKITPH